MRIKLSRKRWISMGITAGLLILIGAVGVALAQEPDGSPDAAPVGETPDNGLTLGPTGGPSKVHGFSYQGQLSDSGSPADGHYDFEVTLWDAETVGTGTQIAPCSDVGTGLNNYHVQDGIFTFYLICGDWNSDVFTGGASRWIQVRVRPHGGGSYTNLGRQPIAPVPYAWSLYPGAIIDSTSYGGGFGDALLNIHNDNTVSTWSAFRVEAASGSAVYAQTNGTALYGVGGAGNGVEGHSTSGTGGYFYSGLGTGLVAMSNGSGHWNHAGYFSAWRGYGILARSTENMAIRGEAGDVSGLWQPAGPVGVAGIGDRGVYGSGSYIGVYGVSDSDSGYGGYFNNAAEDGVGLYVYGDGSGRYKAALRATNWEASGGMAAYLINESNYHTAHLRNYGTGGVLYLQNGGTDGSGTGGGDFITAVNDPANDAQFRVLTSGEVRSDVGFYTPAADFAEMLPAVADLEAGDVLVVGADGKLQRSTKPYQGSVLGVHSTEPGFLGGQPIEGEAEGHVPLAVVGVVPVKASDENGAIMPGDLLTTSSTPGHAMRADADPAVGTVIGKALEGLDEGSDVILMLVMLQ
jgi:hypothetical protein